MQGPSGFSHLSIYARPVIRLQSSKHYRLDIPRRTSGCQISHIAFPQLRLRVDCYDYIDVLIIIKEIWFRQLLLERHVLFTGSQSSTTPEQVWHTSNLKVPINPSCLSLCLTYFLQLFKLRCFPKTSCYYSRVESG